MDLTLGHFGDLRLEKGGSFSLGSCLSLAGGRCGFGGLEATVRDVPFAEPGHLFRGKTSEAFAERLALPQHGDPGKLSQSDTPLGRWLEGMLERGVHRNAVVVALANKLARIAWAILRKETVFERGYTVAA